MVVVGSGFRLFIAVGFVWAICGSSIGYGSGVNGSRCLQKPTVIGCLVLLSFRFIESDLWLTIALN
jgi:hypothetical protein